MGGAEDLGVILHWAVVKDCSLVHVIRIILTDEMAQKTDAKWLVADFVFLRLSSGKQESVER